MVIPVIPRGFTPSSSHPNRTVVHPPSPGASVTARFAGVPCTLLR